MKASARAYSLIKEFEGLRLQSYQCSGGVWTVGYGHTGGVREGQVVSRSEAEALLAEDIAGVETFLSRQGLSLRQCQFDALVSFVFNIGSGNFAKSRLLSMVKADANNRKIFDEFLRWVYSGGRILPGLQKRRLVEAKLYFQY